MNLKWNLDPFKKGRIRGILILIGVILCCALIALWIQQLHIKETSKKHYFLGGEEVNLKDLPAVGVAAEERQDWNRAILIYRNILSQEPNQPVLWKRVAAINFFLKRYEAAAEALVEAIQYEPRNPQIRADLAEIYLILHQPQDALYAINVAVELDPSSKKNTQRQKEIRAIFEQLHPEQ